MKTMIYAILYSSDLITIEKILEEILNKNKIFKIESGTVLVYQDELIELSIEPTYNSIDELYLSAVIKMKLLEGGEQWVFSMGNVLKKNKVYFSIDYEEIDERGKPTTAEYNLKFLPHNN
ncbi:MAG: hypothetical protein LBI72_13375 [Flavobacteriaceae bacterium]|jgi:hypothetical protein|nr:hypothetical protein [Flavobacteriaceae bacterium]